MDMFEKVEKLREKADVSYEEAKAALEKADGDMLEALIILEKDGKTVYSSYSTSKDKNCKDKSRKSEKAGETCKKAKEAGEGFFERVKSLIKKSTENYLVIESKDERVAKIPILLALVIMIFAFYAAVIAILVSLFLGCKYSFEGKDDMSAANEACEKAEEIVADIIDAPETDKSEDSSTVENKED